MSEKVVDPKAINPIMFSTESQSKLSSEEKKSEAKEASLKKLNPKEAENLKKAHINRQTTIDFKCKDDVQNLYQLRDSPFFPGQTESEKRKRI
jgi:hypothetical protein